MILLQRFALPTLLFLTSSAALSSATYAEDFYKGKTLTIVVGFSPGGGFDQQARTLARHIGEHIPGDPTVIVRNMPGAGSLTSVRYLNTNAVKDGTVMTHFYSGLVTESLIVPEKSKLDFLKFSWIGVVTPDFRVCYSYGPDGVKTWDDLMARKEFILGATAKGAANYIGGATLREVLGAPIRQVVGFPGAADQRLAMERGELDGDCGTFSSITPGWIEEKKINLFARFMERKPSEIPDSAVFLGNFAKTEEQKEVIKLLNVGDAVGKPFIMSAEVPSERVSIMRNAFNKTMKNPDFVSDMKKQNLPLDPLSGEAAEQLIAESKNIKSSILAKAKKVYE